MKTKSADWLALASAVVTARDALRRAALDLVGIGARLEDDELRRELGDVLGALTRATDGLRFALKDRRRAPRIRRAA